MSHRRKEFDIRRKMGRGFRKRYSEVYSEEKGPRKRELVETRGGRENEGAINSGNIKGTPDHISSGHFEAYVWRDPLNQKIININPTGGFTTILSARYYFNQDSLSLDYRNGLRDNVENLLRSKKRRGENGIGGELGEIRTLIEKIGTQKSLKRGDYSV